jgi:Baseplate J-like protein
VRQSDGADLLGANNPRRTKIGLIYVAPGDDRQTVLTAIHTQDKLGRKQVAIELPGENKAFQSAVDFDGLKGMQGNLKAQIVFITPSGYGPAEFARQRRFPVYSSLEEYAQVIQDEDLTGEDEDQVSKKGRSFGRKRPLPPPAAIQPSPAETAQPQPSAVESSPSPSQPPASSNVEAAQQPLPGDTDIASVDTVELAANPDTGAPSAGGTPPVVPAHEEEAPTLAAIPAVEDNGPRALNGGSPVAAPAPRRSRLRWLIAALLVFLVLLLVILNFISGNSLLGPLAKILPGAATPVTVTITPASKALNNTYVISAVTLTPDPAQNQVAARMIASVSPAQSKTVKTTGVGHVPGVQAKGQLTFYNAFSHPQTISVGTVLTDANGVQLVNDEAAMIPAATPPTEGSVTVSAHAIDAGVNGNISAFDFDNVPCCTSGVNVRNTSAFSGGQDAYSYAFVEQSDIDGVINPFQASLTQTAQASLKAQLHPGEQFVSSPQCMPGITSDHQAADRATNVSVTVAVTCTGEVYDHQAAQSVAANLLRQEATRDPGSGYALVGNLVTDVRQVSLTDTKKGTLSLMVEADGVWVYQFGAAQKQALVKLLVDKSTQNAQTLLLEQKGVATASIQFSGSNENTLPSDPTQIIIVVQNVAGLHAPASPTTVPTSPTVTITPTLAGTPTPTSPGGTPTPTAGPGS